MSKFYGVARNSSGSVISSPTVTLFLEGTTTPASIFQNSALSTPLANPFTGNVDGTYSFFVVPGSYKLRVEKAGFATFEVDQLVIGSKDDHGLLTGLGDDDHPHYLHLTSARTVVAVHSFNPASAGAPFSLGANAQGNLVTGLNADMVDGVHASALALLAGRSSGQLLRGGTAAIENLTLESTSHATKGKVLVGSGFAFDETNQRLGLKTTSPSAALAIQKAGLNGAADGLLIQDSTTGHAARTWIDSTNGFAHFGTQSTTGVKLFTVDTARVWIDTSGNVGIGAASGGAKLNVSASGAIPNFTGSTLETQVSFQSGGMTWIVRLAGSNPSFNLRDAIAGTEPFSVAPSSPSGSLMISGLGVSLVAPVPSWGGGTGLVYVGNRTVAPTSNPTTGGFLYAEAGAGKWRGSSGTVTTFGPAEPHCPWCTRDFVLDWKNESLGQLSVCLWCLTDALQEAGIARGIFVKKE